MNDNVKVPPIESDLDIRLKYERDRLYTLGCSGSFHEVKALVRVYEIAAVLQEARAELETLTADNARLQAENVMLPIGEARRLISVLRYSAHPHKSPHADYLEGLLTLKQPAQTERPSTEQIFEAMAQRFGMTRDEVIEELGAINYSHFKHD